MTDTVRVVRAAGPGSVRVIRLVDAEIARVIRAAEPPQVVVVRSGPRGLPGPPGPGGGSFFYEVESQGTLTGVNDSALIQAAIDASLAGVALFGRAPVRLRPGVTYRGKQLNPTGSHIVAYGSGIKVPDGGTAHNMFVPTGAWRLEGGDFDGNKGATADPAVTTDGCGVYQATTSAGWAGSVVIKDATFHDFWWQSTNFDNTDATLHDAVNAPAAAVYLDRVKTLNCAHIGQRFTGIQHVRLVEPFNTGSGSHGMRFFLCRDVVVQDGWSCDNPSGHGLTTLYCYDMLVRGGHYDRNGLTSLNHNGITIGGDSTSNVNMPGRFVRVEGATANGNGKQGIVEDATVASLNTLLADVDYPAGRTNGDPIPTWNRITDCTANGNGDQGITVNASQFVTIINAITDHNVGHGIQLATRNCTVINHHAWYNGQKPLALQGTVNWGDHYILGVADYKHNSPDDTLTITNANLAIPSRFSQSVYSRRAVTASTTAKIGELLALDTTAGTLVVTLPECSFVAPGRITAKWVAGTVAPTFALTGSDKIDTSSSTAVPVFTTLGQSYTLESDPVTGIWTLVGGVASTKAPALKLIGTANGSGPGYPNTGGSGAGGVPAQGDAWFVSVGGSFPNLMIPGTATSVEIGDLLYAKVADPNSVSPIGSAWTIPESKTHKDTDVTLATNSDVLYPSQKAVKTYIDTADALKAPLASPALTGNPTAPTQALGNNSTRIANTAFVIAQIAALINSAPGFADTLGEIAALIAADESTASALAATVAGKQPLDDVLSTLSGLPMDTDLVPFFTGVGTADLMLVTGFMRGLLEEVNSAGALSTLGAQPLDATLSALAGVATAADKLIYATGVDAFATTTLSSFIRTLLDDANAAAALTTLGAQPADAELSALAGLTSAADQLAYFTGSGTAALTTLSAFIRTLLDDANAAAALATLGAQDASKLDTDGTLAANSASKYPSQSAVKTYVDTLLANNQTGTAYTLALSDWGLVVELNNAAAIALTVPLNATLALPVGFWSELWVQGAGQVTVTPESGTVNLRSNGNRLKSNGQFSSITLRKRATNEWAVTGDLTT